MKPRVFQILPIIFILLITTIFLYQEVFRNQIIWGPDSPKIFFPLTLVLSEWLKNLSFPFWTPYIYFGYPLSAEGQLGLFYPPNWIHFFFSPGTALNILTFSHIFLSGVFAYFFGRTIKLSKMASLIIGVSFMFSGQLISHLQDLPKVYTYPYLPLILALIYKSIKSGTRGFLALASVFLALQALPGHPNIPLMTALFSTIFLIYFSLKKLSLKIIIRNLLIMTSLYFLLILPKVMDTLTLLPMSLRTGAIDFMDHTHASFYFFDLITYVFPHFFFLNLAGSWVFSPTFHSWTYWGSVEAAIYFGIPSLILAIFGLKSSHPLKRFFIFSSLLFFLIALGRNTPFYKEIVFKIPIFNALRSPARYMYLADFSLIILAGLGFDKLISLKRSLKYILFLFTLPLALLFSLYIASSLIYANYSQFSSFLERTYQNLGPSLDTPSIVNGFLGSLSPLQPQTLQQIILVTITSLLMILIILANQKTKNVFAGCLVVLLSADLLLNTYPINLHRPKSPLLNPPDNLEQLKTVLGTNNSRLYTFMSFWSDYMPDQLLPEKVMEGNGFSGLPLRRFNYYQKQAEKEWLEEKTGKLFALGSIQKVFGDHQGKPNLVENGLFLPRTYIVPNYILEKNEGAILKILQGDSFNPFTTVLLEEEPTPPVAESPVSEAEARILKFKPFDDTIEIEAYSKNQSFLVLTDTNYRGWQATLDGKPSKIYQANYLFRAISLPPGHHRVIFKYSPPFLKVIIIISLITLFSISFWVLKKRD